MPTRKAKGSKVFIANALMILKARDMTIAQWATKAGISSRALRKYLNDEQRPGLEVLDALAEAADLSLPELLTEGLTADLVKSRELATMTTNYVASRPRARRHALDVLVDDLRYEKSA